MGHQTGTGSPLPLFGNKLTIKAIKLKINIVTKTPTNVVETQPNIITLPV